ncbi:ERF family protein [Falsigemmobacter faecalis]|uniref:ERF family protein n=1 Tax=Falsigemmobacter faecalis TaxID=2488730 RepID=A0A3P3DEU7_9RHOB|nr:ERF family protein [Falsigemmobacter faecalis]RRH72022.1 ERF family protein [Falsigemmobacter faecalis]
MSDLTPINEEGTAVVAVDPMVSMIERVVMNPQADLDKLERMLAMKERLDAQNARVAFAGALSAARAEIPPIVKDATVDFKTKDGKRTHYQHETLAGIAKVIDPVLAQYGLSYRFRTGQNGGGVTVTCIIAHSAGHSEETSLSCSPDGSGSKNAFQAVGSAVTYLQRYTLKAALGLSAEVDDDGQSAAPRHEERQKQPSHAEAEAEALITALNSAASEPELQEIWDAESDTRKRIHAGDPAQYDRVKAAAAQRKKALQAQPLTGEILDDSIPYEGPNQ